MHHTRRLDVPQKRKSCPIEMMKKTPDFDVNVSPLPGFVLKTRRGDNVKTKVFVNVWRYASLRAILFFSEKEINDEKDGHSPHVYDVVIPDSLFFECSYNEHDRSEVENIACVESD